MNWEAIGAIGDIVGAVAVVLTLLYLARQTRLSRKSAVSASRSLSAVAISEIDRDIARDPELAKIAYKGFNSKRSEFDEMEWFRFTTFARSLVGLFEDQYMQSLDQTTDPEVGEIHTAAMVGLLAYPAWAEFWRIETLGNTWRRRFIEAVNCGASKAKIPGAVIAGRDEGGQ